MPILLPSSLVFSGGEGSPIPLRASSTAVRVLACVLPLAIGAALALLARASLVEQREIGVHLERVRARLEEGRALEQSLLGLEGAWRGALLHPEGEAAQDYAWRRERLRAALARMRAQSQGKAVRDGLAAAADWIERWHADVAAPALTEAERHLRAGDARRELEALLAADTPAALRERLRGRLGALQDAFRWNDRAHDATLEIERDLEAMQGAQRAFVISGRSEDLGRLEAAEGALLEHLAQLRQIAPRERAAVDALVRLAERWRREVAEPQIAARRALPAGLARAEPEARATGSQSALLEAAQQSLHGALGSERTLELELEERLSTRSGRSLVQMLTGAGLILVVCTLSMLLLARRAAVAPAPAGALGALARIDSRLDLLARRQDALLARSGELEASRALLSQVLGDGGGAGGGPRRQAADLLRWLARSSDTLLVALYTVRGTPGALHCEHAVGCSGQTLDTAFFSPRGFYDDVLGARGKLVIEGPFELAGECLGLGAATVVARCVVGWPIRVGERCVGVLLSAHPRALEPADEARIAPALEWLAAHLLVARDAGPLADADIESAPLSTRRLES